MSRGKGLACAVHSIKLGLRKHWGLIACIEPCCITNCSSCGFGCKVGAGGWCRQFSSSSPLQGIRFWKPGSAGVVSTCRAQGDTGRSHGGTGVPAPAGEQPWKVSGPVMRAGMK